TAGERALDKLRARENPGRSWYLDLALVLEYWTPGGSSGRSYHHTAPINMVYALREALRIAVGDDWLPTAWERHRRAHHALRDALAVLGCERVAPDGEQLHPLLAVRVPEGLDETGIRRALLHDHRIEISGGLGPFAGRVWRIGVMGEGARPQPQERLVRALAAQLRADPTDALAALAEGWA
ncbi:MAG: alanine--glyoxylate aminotransferase family protein, partial [Actinomycetota bacterium]|nr:alanine--glyoxylate aminotransferase family protein [Actinomycetota bacterium]